MSSEAAPSPQPLPSPAPGVIARDYFTTEHPESSSSRSSSSFRDRSTSNASETTVPTPDGLRSPTSTSSRGPSALGHERIFPVRSLMGHGKRQEANRSSLQISSPDQKRFSAVFPESPGSAAGEDLVDIVGAMTIKSNNLPSEPAGSANPSRCTSPRSPFPSEDRESFQGDPFSFAKARMASTYSVEGAAKPNADKTQENLADPNAKDDIMERARVAHMKGEAEDGPSDATVSDFQSTTTSKASRRSIGGASSATESSHIGYMTARFKHVQTEDGHMVLTGRHGVLQKCEDEPIHLPGAIQSFGVLVALEENEDGKFLVKQVSENSATILGYTPSDLLALQCFTEIFSDSQREVLYDAFEALDEREAPVSETGPHNFEIKGQGKPGSGPDGNERLKWHCWCALHRPDKARRPKLSILEFELQKDLRNPLITPFGSEESDTSQIDTKSGMKDTADFKPKHEDLLQSTKSWVKPLRALHRMRKSGAPGMQVFTLLSQINEELAKAEDLQSFLEIAVGVIREVSEFHRVMIYQFDPSWNGQVVAELVDYDRTHDLYRGLHFPASDIPAQARELYKLSKIRLLYDRDQPTSRLVCRDKDELRQPLDMTYSILRAMSPIHIKYLANMGVRASMSISIVAFGQLWGLISCHSYGTRGQRISFPIRQMCLLLGESISRNIERISYAQRLQSRKLINTTASVQNPNGYIVAKAEDLLTLFDADFGVLSIGEEAKLLGPLESSQEVLAVLDFLRQKHFQHIQVAQDIGADIPELEYHGGFKIIAGMLLVPLTGSGQDFIAFFRRGQLRHVHWAGNPYQKVQRAGSHLEPRTSFKAWSETVVGKCRAWSDEHLETAAVLGLVYGKFIEIHRQKEQAENNSKITNLLLSNSAHEFRTPLNAIINYLELALDGPLDNDTRESLHKSYTASRTLVHVINDLLDLTRTTRGLETSSSEPFNIRSTIEDAVFVQSQEAERRGVQFEVVETPTGTPTLLLGDRVKVRQIVANIAANAVKHTSQGKITVEWGEMQVDNSAENIEQRGDHIKIGISINDTGIGIPEHRLETMFLEFEQVTKLEEKPNRNKGSVGLGLAVVARITTQLGGQLRVESKEGLGSKFTIVLPFGLPAGESATSAGSDTSVNNSSATSRATRSIDPENPSRGTSSSAKSHDLAVHHGPGSVGSVKSRLSGGSGSQRSEIDSLVAAMSTSSFDNNSPIQYKAAPSAISKVPVASGSVAPPGEINIEDSGTRLRSAKVDEVDVDVPMARRRTQSSDASGHYRVPSSPTVSSTNHSRASTNEEGLPRMRVMVVEDDPINRAILTKKLKKEHNPDIAITVHGEEAIRLYEKDRDFDIILMDIQMPICDGVTATRRIRELEAKNPTDPQKMRQSHKPDNRVPIFAVSASLLERQRNEMIQAGFSGWILKPIDFSRLSILIKSVFQLDVRRKELYQAGEWEKGGWLKLHPSLRDSTSHSPTKSRFRRASQGGRRTSKDTDIQEDAESETTSKTVTPTGR